MTANAAIRCIADTETGAEIELGFRDDMLVHDGKFFGDFEICGGHAPHQNQALDHFGLF
jgi:hypothetical protein